MFILSARTNINGRLVVKWKSNSHCFMGSHCQTVGRRKGLSNTHTRR